MPDTQTKSTREKEARKPGEDTVEMPGLPGFDSMQGFRQGALNMEHWILTQQELSRFWAYRIRKNLSTLDAFAKCKKSEDFVSALAQAASDTAHDYANEYDRVLRINTSSAN